MKQVNISNEYIYNNYNKQINPRIRTKLLSLS